MEPSPKACGDKVRSLNEAQQPQRRQNFCQQLAPLKQRPSSSFRQCVAQRTRVCSSQPPDECDAIRRVSRSHCGSPLALSNATPAEHWQSHTGFSMGCSRLTYPQNVSWESKSPKTPKAHIRCVPLRQTGGEFVVLEKALPNKDLMRGRRSEHVQTKQHVPSWGLQERGCYSQKALMLGIPALLLSEEQEPAKNCFCCNDLDAAWGTARLPGKSLRQHIKTAISCVLKQFEATALQKLNGFIRTICIRQQVHSIKEENLSLQVNERLLQSLHLESLSTDNLSKIMSLSAQLHGRQMCRGLTKGSCSASGPTMLRIPRTYNLKDGQTPRGKRAHYSMSPRGCVSEGAVSARRRLGALHAIDLPDEFSDILGRLAQEERLLGTCCNTACSSTATHRPQRVCPADAIWSSRSKMRGEGAAEREAAAAAAAAERFLHLNGGGSMSPSFGLKRTRKRTREDPPKKPFFHNVVQQHDPMMPAASCNVPEALAHRRYSWLQLGLPEVASKPPIETWFMSRQTAKDNAPTKMPSVQHSCLMKRRCAKPLRMKPPKSTDFVLRTGLEIPAFSLFEPHQGLSQDTAPCKYRSSNKYKCDGKEALASTPLLACAEGPPPSLHGSSCPRSSVADPTSACCRSPVKGVYYDSSKKLWRAQWHAAVDSKGLALDGKRISRSFNCSRLGYDLARAMAVAWMLSAGSVGDETLLLISKEGKRKRSLDPSSVRAALAAATSWEQIDDCQIKELVVFHDPKRFLSKIEEVYLSQKASKAVRPPGFPCHVLGANNSSSSSTSAVTSLKRDAAIAKAPKSDSGSAAAAGFAREASAGRSEIPGGFASDKPAVLFSMSLNDMLEVVWGSPRAAADSILAAG